MDDKLINIYSDESRHLEGQASTMVIGSVWCNASVTPKITDLVKLIKTEHQIPRHREIKWTKISPAKLQYYEALIDLFFDEDLNFRAVTIPTEGLKHEHFGQSTDEFYYKMQYTMLMNIIKKHNAQFKIYLDYKDAWSNTRTKELAEYVSRHQSDGLTFSAQPVRSTESIPLQIADLLIGAVAYANNENELVGAKGEIVEHIENKSGQRLTQQTPFGVDKFNIFMWQPRDV